MPLTDGAIALKNKINKAMKTELVIPGSQVEVAHRFTTGSLSLDVALGGGWPGNLWSEVVGPFSAGKTAMVNKSIAANQMENQYFTAMWIAAEHYDVDQASALGVDLERVLVVPMQDMATAFEIMLEAAESRGVDMIVLDSYPALLPEDEGDKAMNEFVVGSGARLMNKFCRKAQAVSQRALNGTDPPFTGIIINQYRDLIGGFSPYGTPKTTPGGKGKDYFFHTRVEVKRGDWIEEKRPGIEKPLKVGQEMKFTTIKNKSASPMQVAGVDYYFRRAAYLGHARGSYDSAKEYIQVGRMLGIITGSTWLNYAGSKWQGKENMAEGLREDPLLREALRIDVMNAANDPQMLDRRIDG